MKGFHISPAKLVNCDQILDHVADQDYMYKVQQSRQISNIANLAEI